MSTGSSGLWRVDEGAGAAREMPGGVAAALALFAFVMGGIYPGALTVTEAAGCGATGALLLTFLRGRLKARETFATPVGTARMTAVMFFIFFDALTLNNYGNLSGVTSDLREWLTLLGGHSMLVIVAIFLDMSEIAGRIGAAEGRTTPVSDKARFSVVPGGNHGDGRGPANIDLVAATANWAEQGTAPESLMVERGEIRIPAYAYPTKAVGKEGGYACR